MISFFRSRKLLFKTAAFVFLVAMLAGCKDIYGPDRTVTFENTTAAPQTFTLDVNEEDDEREVSVASGESVRVSFTGTYTKSELQLPYVWESAGDDYWRIVEAPKEEWTISNNLSVPVTLKDALNPSFQVAVSLSGSGDATAEIHRTAHSFYLAGDKLYESENGENDGGDDGVEDEGVRYIVMENGNTCAYTIRILAADKKY